jgi:hypothetical protein
MTAMLHFSQTRNEYQITCHEIMEPDLIEVRGSAFCIEDLYDFVGKAQHACQFFFREGSDAYTNYRSSFTGLIVYSPKQRAALESAEPTEETEDRDILRIRCLYPEPPQQKMEDLKYKGVSIHDLEWISFMPLAKPAELYEDGTKVVPGIVYVDMGDTTNLDVDVLAQSLFVSKHNSGTELIPYEKDRLIGITLGMNDGHIDSRILKRFGYDAASASASDEIAYQTLKTKQRRKKASGSELDCLRDLEAVRIMSRAALLLEEVKRSGVNVKELNKDLPQLAAIQESLKDFEPHVLVNGRKQVYWDLRGYLHIALRHLKEMQIGAFKGKTPFPYRATELETLAEKVLGLISDEIHRHFLKPLPHGEFRRTGRWAVYFNGDHYALRIDGNGRLVMFHVEVPR